MFDNNIYHAPTPTLDYLTIAESNRARVRALIEKYNAQLLWHSISCARFTVRARFRFCPDIEILRTLYYQLNSYTARLRLLEFMLNIHDVNPIADDITADDLNDDDTATWNELNTLACSAEYAERENDNEIQRYNKAMADFSTSHADTIQLVQSAYVALMALDTNAELSAIIRIGCKAVSAEMAQLAVPNANTATQSKRWRVSAEQYNRLRAYHKGAKRIENGVMWRAETRSQNAVIHELTTDKNGDCWHKVSYRTCSPYRYFNIATDEQADEFETIRANVAPVWAHSEQALNDIYTLLDSANLNKVQYAICMDMLSVHAEKHAQRARTEYLKKHKNDKCAKRDTFRRAEKVASTAVLRWACIKNDVTAERSQQRIKAILRDKLAPVLSE